jgi:hypothetical protein
MPFDGRLLTIPPTEALARFRDNPTLPDLAIILRDRSVWPAGFEWDYKWCTSCAMGLAARLAGAITRHAENLDAEIWARRNLRAAAYPEIFYYQYEVLGLPDHTFITPEHVADAIDRLSP